jgi:hypothetical protein
MRRAWDRIKAVPAKRLGTGFGTIEYTQKGLGVPLLIWKEALNAPTMYYGDRSTPN